MKRVPSPYCSSTLSAAKFSCANRKQETKVSYVSGLFPAPAANRLHHHYYAMLTIIIIKLILIKIRHTLALTIIIAASLREPHT